MTISCNRKTCDRKWPYDPVLEIRCPTCGADIWTKCKRPSGHGGNYVHPHAARDRFAVADGHYVDCPLGICAESLAQMPSRGTTRGSKSSNITLEAGCETESENEREDKTADSTSSRSRNCDH